MKLIKPGISAFLCTVLVVACSGSDRGSGPTTSTPIPSNMAMIDAGSAKPIARGVVDTVFAGGKLGDVLGFISNAPVSETTSPCASGGSVTVSGEVADPSTLSAGDRVLLRFSDCDDGAGRTLRGSYEVEVSSFSGDLVQGLFHLNAEVTLDGFEVAEAQGLTSLTGTATLDVDTTMPPTTTLSVIGDTVSVNDATDAATLTAFRFDASHDAGVAPNAHTSAASGTLASTRFEGVVNFNTPVRFLAFAGEYPFAGELMVAGADGGSVSVLALDNVNVRLDIDPGDGSGIVSDATTWVELSGPAIAGGTGIRGQVIRGPIAPGPEIEGVSNEEPFSASFGVLDAENIEVARFESDVEGMFEVALPPGEYIVVPDASAPIVFPEQQTVAVTVPEDGFAEVVLEFDTGIR